MRRGATCSSFVESLIPLRALALHGQQLGNQTSLEAARGASEVLLKHQLYLNQEDGEVLQPEFAALHYPCYGRYDTLSALKVMAEAGFVQDPRCHAALDLLESRQLRDSGFPADSKHYRVGRTGRSGDSLVDWGGTSKRKMNEFVTADALHVMRATGRLSLLGVR